MVVMEGDEERMKKNGETRESSVGCLTERMDGFLKYANVDMTKVCTSFVCTSFSVSKLTVMAKLIASRKL